MGKVKDGSPAPDEALTEVIAPRDAFRIALYHQTRTGSATIAAASLSRYDQRLFKTAFQSILKLLELTTATFVGSV